MRQRVSPRPGVARARRDRRRRDLPRDRARCRRGARHLGPRRRAAGPDLAAPLAAGRARRAAPSAAARRRARQGRREGARDRRPRRAPFAGSVDPARMRLLADVPRAGMRAYLVPVTAPGARPGRERAALLLFATRDGRRVFRPAGVTVAALRVGALHAQVGLRSVPGRGRERARADARAAAPAHPRRHRVSRLRVPRRPRHGRRPDPHRPRFGRRQRDRGGPARESALQPASAVDPLRGGAGTVRERALPSLAGRGEISPTPSAPATRSAPVRRGDRRSGFGSTRPAPPSCARAAACRCTSFAATRTRAIALYPDGALFLLTDGSVHGHGEHRSRRLLAAETRRDAAARPAAERNRLTVPGPGRRRRGDVLVEAEEVVRVVGRLHPRHPLVVVAERRAHAPLPRRR